MRRAVAIPLFMILASCNGGLENAVDRATMDAQDAITRQQVRSLERQVRDLQTRVERLETEVPANATHAAEQESPPEHISIVDPTVGNNRP